jgi:hypothetical protein
MLGALQLQSCAKAVPLGEAVTSVVTRSSVWPGSVRRALFWTRGIPVAQVEGAKDTEVGVASCGFGLTTATALIVDPIVEVGSVRMPTPISGHAPLISVSVGLATLGS